MHKSFLIRRAAPLAVLALLAACNSEPETVTVEPSDPTENAVQAAPPVALPPSLTASRTYRCKDNSVAYIDFFSDGISADIRQEKTGPAIRLTAPAAGEPFVAEGYTLTGSTETVTLAQPGKPSQSCKA